MPRCDCEFSENVEIRVDGDYSHLVADLAEVMQKIQRCLSYMQSNSWSDSDDYLDHGYLTLEFCGFGCELVSPYE